MKFGMIVILAFILWGCTHTRHLSQIENSDEIEQINRLGVGKESKIIPHLGETITALDIHVHADQTYFLNVNSRQKDSITTSEIREIHFKRSGKGALEGLGIGLLFGATTGVVGGFLSGDDDPGWFAMTAEEKATGLGIIGGIGGGILGLPIGAATGSREIFVFPEDSVSNNLLTIPDSQTVINTRQP